MGPHSTTPALLSLFLAPNIRLFTFIGPFNICLQTQMLVRRLVKKVQSACEQLMLYAAFHDGIKENYQSRFSLSAKCRSILKFQCMESARIPITVIVRCQVAHWNSPNSGMQAHLVACLQGTQLSGMAVHETAQPRP